MPPPPPTLLDTPADSLLPDLLSRLPSLTLRTLRHIQTAVSRNNGPYPAALSEISPLLGGRGNPKTIA